jgi:hypothetical protein
MFGYALAKYLERRATQAQTVSLTDLAFGAGAPGRVFCLSESGLLSRLEALEDLTAGALVYDETAGLKQVFLHKPLLPKTLLEQYYATARKEVAWSRRPTPPKR